MKHVVQTRAVRWVSVMRWVAVVSMLATIAGAIGTWVLSGPTTAVKGNGVVIGSHAQIGTILQSGDTAISPHDGRGGNGGSVLVNNSAGTFAITGSAGRSGPPYAARGGNGGSGVVNGSPGSIICTGNGGDAGQVNGKGGRVGENPCLEMLLRSLPPEIRARILPNTGRGGNGGNSIAMGGEQKAAMPPVRQPSQRYSKADADRMLAALFKLYHTINSNVDAIGRVDGFWLSPSQQMQGRSIKEKVEIAIRTRKYVHNIAKDLYNVIMPKYQYHTNELQPMIQGDGVIGQANGALNDFIDAANLLPANANFQLIKLMLDAKQTALDAIMSDFITWARDSKARITTERRKIQSQLQQ